jgi:hypothetical protein
MKPSKRPKKIIPGKGRSKTPSKIPSSKHRKVSHNDWTFNPKLINSTNVLHGITDKYTVEYYSVCVNAMRDLITKLVQNHGFTDGSARYKKIRSYTIDLIEGRSPDNPEWLATSVKYNVPSQLGTEIIQIVVDFIRMDKEDVQRPKLYQVLMTLLYQTRIVEGLVDMDLSSIEGDYQPISEEILKSFETYVSEKLKSWKLNPENLEKYNKVNLNNISGYRVNLKKNGPNGVPKIESASREASCLRKSKLWGPFTRLCDELGITHLSSYVDNLSTVHCLEYPEDDQSVRLRVLAPVPDSDFKTRVVAVVDFWTQLSLEPVRAWVQLVTEKLFKETNFTDSHDRGFNTMVEFQKKCLNKEIPEGCTEALQIEKLKFFDFVSWTDRYHRDLQKITVGHLISGRFAEAWAQLVVHCSWNVPQFKRTIKYSQGQGMGTNGSFDIATLTDHLFINWVYDTQVKSGYIPNGNRCYGKVGDDLWIYDPTDVFEKAYSDINLEINLAKSKTFCELGSVGEFCSRLSLNGTDVSRVSPKVISGSSDFRNLPALLNVCAKVGIQLMAKDFEQLSHRTKLTEETYYNQLQPFLISAFIMSEVAPTLYGSSSLDYLVTGDWLDQGSIATLEDQDEKVRLMICHSIMNIKKNHLTIVEKVAELSGDNSNLKIEEINELLAEKSCLFNPEGAGWSIAQKFFGTTDFLSPKQVIVMRRWINQKVLTSIKLTEAHSIEGEDVYDIIKFSKALEKIATESSYDQGNISYDRSRWRAEINSLVQTKRRTDSGCKLLYLDSQSEVELIDSLLSYDELPVEWSPLIPNLIVGRKEE